MKRIILLSTFILTLSAQAQPHLSGTVISSDDGSPVAYATVYFSRYTSSTYTNEQGVFKLSSKDSLEPDSLFIKCLGYKSTAYTVKEITKKQPGLFSIDPLPVSLSEVTISPKRKSLEPGKIRGKSYSSHLGPTKGIHLEIARRISLGTIPERYIKLKKIKYYVQDDIFDVSKYNAPFGVRLYVLDSITNKPGKEILTTNIVISAKRKNRWVIADLDSLNIYLPHTDVFAAMEWLPVYDEFWWEHEFTRNGERKVYREMRYGQHLGLAKEQNEKGHYSRSNHGFWFFWGSMPHLEFHTPMIYIEVEVFD